MGLKKWGLLGAFVVGLALFLILSAHRGFLTSSFTQNPSPAMANTMVMYALATPANVPGLSRKSDRENEHLFGRVKAVLHEQFYDSKVLWLFTTKRSRLISSTSFNPEGNKTEETIFNTGGASVFKTSYSYDSNGRKSAQVMGQGIIHGETTYSYNQDGRE